MPSVTILLFCSAANESGAMLVEGKYMHPNRRDRPILGSVSIEGCAGDWQEVRVPVKMNGVEALYFEYRGSGAIDVLSFDFL